MGAAVGTCGLKIRQGLPLLSHVDGILSRLTGRMGERPPRERLSLVRLNFPISVIYDIIFVFHNPPVRGYLLTLGVKVLGGRSANRKYIYQQLKQATCKNNEKYIHQTNRRHHNGSNSRCRCSGLGW